MNILKSYECRVHLQLLQNNASFNIFSELSINSEDTKSLPVVFSLNYNLDLISVLHFHNH